MQEVLASFAGHAESRTVTNAIQALHRDPRFDLVPPTGGMVVRVHAKILGGYEPSKDPWREIFENALSRDNLWISADEQRQLVAGEITEPLARRIAKFHLVDGTRGEPLMWTDQEIRSVTMKLSDGVVIGKVHLESDDGSRGYECSLRGVVESQGDRVSRFGLVAVGNCWGAGPYTKNPPPGKFPLAVSFSLADGTDIADAVPPQGCKGWLEGYMPRSK